MLQVCSVCRTEPASAVIKFRESSKFQSEKWLDHTEPQLQSFNGRYTFVYYDNVNVPEIILLRVQMHSAEQNSFSCCYTVAL